MKHKQYKKYVKYIMLLSAFCWIMHPCIKGAIHKNPNNATASKEAKSELAVQVKKVERLEGVEKIEKIEKVVNAKDFGVLPDGSDATYGIRRALQYC